MRNHRLLYWSIEVNLILWLAVLGAAFSDPRGVKAVAAAGLVLSAILQHWGYYRLLKAGGPRPRDAGER